MIQIIKKGPSPSYLLRHAWSHSTGNYCFFWKWGNKWVQPTPTTWLPRPSIPSPFSAPSCYSGEHPVQLAYSKHTYTGHTHSATAQCAKQPSDNLELMKFFLILWHHWDTHDMTLPRIQWDTQSTFPGNRFKPVVWCVCVCVYIYECVWRREAEAFVNPSGAGVRVELVHSHYKVCVRVLICCYDSDRFRGLG